MAAHLTLYDYRFGTITATIVTLPCSVRLEVTPEYTCGWYEQHLLNQMGGEFPHVFTINRI